MISAWRYKGLNHVLIPCYSDLPSQEAEDCPQGRPSLRPGHKEPLLDEGEVAKGARHQ